MKIAMLTTIGERCGIAAYSRELISALETLPDTEVELIPIHEGNQSAEHYLEQAEKINSQDVDVVHIQHEHSFWGGILPGKSSYWKLRYLIKKPVVLTAHTTYTAAEMLKLPTERRPLKRLGKQLLMWNRAWVDSIQIAPFATAVTIVHTHAARQSLIARGAKPGYIHTIPAGVPAPLKAATGGKSFRARFQLERKRLITLFGYISPNKGYELTLSLLASLPDDVMLIIAGGPRNESMLPYFHQLQAEVKERGLHDRALFTDYLSEEDVAEVFAASELAVVPHTVATGSYSVTLPIAYGSAILASDLDCFREINMRMECIELFHSGIMEDYGSKLINLLNNEERKRYLSERAKEYAKRFSWNWTARNTVSVYKSAINIYNSGPHHIPGGPPEKPV